MSKNQESRFEITEKENCDEYIFIPGEDSGESDNDGSNDEDELDENVNNLSVPSPCVSYSKVFDEYDNTQKKLEKDHEYVWKKGEKVYNHSLKNEIYFSETDKKTILSSSPVEIFEFFFSLELNTIL